MLWIEEYVVVLHFWSVWHICCHLFSPTDMIHVLENYHVILCLYTLLLVLSDVIICRTTTLINVNFTLLNYLTILRNWSVHLLFFQAIATARMRGEYPERIGQPECQACTCYPFFQTLFLLFLNKFLFYTRNVM